MALSDLQFSYRGLTFGAGTEYHVNRAEGFEGYEVRTSDSDQPRGDGAIRGLDYVAARTIAFELAVIGLTDGDTTYEEYWDQVRSTFRPSREDDFVLTFARPGQPERIIRCRPVSLVRIEDYKRFNTVGFPPVVLRAADPRVYSSSLHTAYIPPYSSSGGGIDFPLNPELDFGTTTSIEAVVANAGTADAYPVVQFFGPGTGTVTAVKLTNTTTDQELEITATVTSGQILQADMEAAVTGANRLVISLDGSTRYGDWELPREPFALAPGSNTLRYEITGTSTDAVCHISWRDTWLD